jgi:hypothetical protein
MPDVSLETILVAVIAGLGGGLAGTWLQIRHERDEAFRNRLITAADDLATGLQQAIIGLDEAYSTALKYGYVDAQNRVTWASPETGQVAPETEEAFAQARKLIGEARARTARVSLLFGPVSAPDRSATLALMHLDGTLMALDAWPVTKLDEFSKQLGGARTYLADFNRWALQEVRGRPWWRRWGWALWLRRRARRLRRRQGMPKQEAGS